MSSMPALQRDLSTPKDMNGPRANVEFACIYNTYIYILYVYDICIIYIIYI